MSKCRCDNIGINLLSRNPLPEIPTFKCYHWNFYFKWFSWFSSEYIGKLLQTFPAAVFWLLKWSLVALSKDVHGCLSVKSGRDWSWIFFPPVLVFSISLNLFCKKCDWRYNLKPSLHECFRRKWTLPKGNTDKYLFTKMREIMEIIWQQKFSQCGLEVRYISLLTEWLFYVSQALRRHFKYTILIKLPWVD